MTARLADALHKQRHLRESAAIRMLEGPKQEAQNGDGLETKRGDRI